MIKSKTAKWIAGIAVATSLLGATVAYANPRFFGNPVTTGNTASSTPAYLVPGTSTSTTPVYDAYAQTQNGAKFKADKATLALQFTGSSTLSTLNASIEYSNDGIDWYRNFVIDPNAMGTTTTPYSLATPESINWKFASSTVGGVALTASNGATSTAYMLIPTPARYTRVVISLTGDRGSVWAQIVPIKEQL